jgi:gas vesicle protein
MSSQNSGVLFFAGLMTGGVVGAGLALLLSPQSGAETRSQIKDKSLELKDQAAEGLAEASQRAQAQADAWQEKGQDMAKAVSRSKDNIIQVISQSKDKVVEATGFTKADNEKSKVS